jgi:RHS repeat-associated protein
MRLETIMTTYPGPVHAPTTPTCATRNKRMRWLLLTLLALGALPTSLVAQTTTQVVEFYHTDATGSVRAVTKQVNGTWQVVKRYDFIPFGEELAAQPLPAYKFLFTGKERDFETGQDYFGARYYGTGLGRFTTVDPELNIKDALVDPQRWNRYAYVANNPLKYTDPDGKNPLLIGGGIGAAVYGGWAIYQNVSSGAPHWYNNVGVEATKGLMVGMTLGLAAPALAAADVGLGTGTVVLDAAAIGKAREVFVAELVGGRVAGDAKVTLQGVGTTAIDVYGKAGEFIGVGGPAKAIDLAQLGGKLKVLAGAAEQAGVKAMYFFEKGTPEAAVRLAQKWLGKENVVVFER